MYVPQLLSNTAEAAKAIKLFFIIVICFNVYGCKVNHFPPNRKGDIPEKCVGETLLSHSASGFTSTGK